MRFAALREEERNALHEAALSLLEETGLAASAALVDTLQGGGLEVPGGGGRVRLPRRVVEQALAAAPRAVRLGARGEGRGLLLEGRRTYAATDGCAAKAVDPTTGATRKATLADVARSARLADALSEFDLYWMMVSAQDVPRETRVAQEYRTALANTTMHVQMIDMARRDEADALVQMARLLAEQGVVTSGPPVSALISVVSPLRLDPDGLEAALSFAAADLPIVACSMPIASVTSPATPAGNLLIAHAECLALITILETLHPGAPVIYCSFASYADPRTGATSYDDPRGTWTAAAAAQLGRSLGIPCFSSGGLLALMTGPDLTSGGGLIETSTVLSDEQLVIDNEALRDCRIAAALPEVTPETLAVDVIREVGPGGHFLARKHTLRHMKEYVVTKYAGGDRERARQEARRLAESHSVPPLPAPIEAALAEIAAGAVRR
jgi:trimethylamine--corrinoid protein Co-methyltransferase